MIERIRPYGRALMLSVPLFAIALSGCGGGNESDTPSTTTTEPVQSIEPAESSNNIEHFQVGSVESYGADTRIWYYEYTDREGREHVCDLATNARGGTQGVGLSCEVFPAEATTTTTSIPG